METEQVTRGSPLSLDSLFATPADSRRRLVFVYDDAARTVTRTPHPGRFESILEQGFGTPREVNAE